MSATAQAFPRIPVPDEVRTWARQGSETIATAAKIISDLSAQEIALAIGLVRERITSRPGAPAVEAAGKLMTGAVKAGNILLDLAAGETAVATEAFKQVVGLRPELGAIADLLPQGIGTMIEVQKKFLDSVGEQTKELVENYTEGKPLMIRENVAAATRKTMEQFIAAQKAFLNQVNEQVIIATDEDVDSRPARRDRSKVLTQLAQEAVDKFIEAQKQVFELAVHQISAIGGRSRAKAAPRRTFAILARESVQNFTTAQKSLLDLALKPSAPAPKPHRPRPSHRPAPRTRAAGARRRTAPKKESAETT